MRLDDNCLLDSNPFLKTGKTRAILNLSGTIPVAKEVLNTISKGLDITDLMSLNILVGILKGPVAFDSFSLSISASISVVEVGKR